MQLMKPAASYIALPLTNMLNSFIKKEKFRTKWKTFSYLEFEHQPNYQIIDQWPISVLPVLPKNRKISYETSSWISWN